MIFVDDIDDVPAGVPLMLSAHGSAPEVVAAARAKDRFVVNAVCPLVTKVHHEAKVRAGKGYTILYVGHAGHDEAVGTLAVAPESIRLVEHDEDLDAVLAAVADPAARSRCSRRPRSRSTTGRASPSEARGEFPELWTATRNDLCFATTNRQEALSAIAARADAVVVIGSANSSNTIALGEGGDDRRLPDRAARRRPRRARPRRARRRGDRRRDRRRERARGLVEQVIAHLAPTEGVELVHVTDEDEYFPPPRELRELLPALVRRARLGARRRTSTTRPDPGLAPRRPQRRRVDASSPTSPPEAPNGSTRVSSRR